ncbi:MAG: type IV secretion system DNA-binding domain-containing protein [Candidatus Paceibacterota bacterium]|jgi:hypothetical protein
MIWPGIERALIRVLETGSGLRRSEREQPYPSGLLLGMASHPYDARKWERVFLPEEERLKHLYILGSTGSGKTKLIEHFIRQDVLASRGFCLIDAHGDLSNNILQYLASLAATQDSFAFLEELAHKLILIEPFNQQGAVGFNPLEVKRFSSFAQVSEMMGIFRKIWQDAYWGPRMEELLRSTLITLSENGLTLLETDRLLTDTYFREKLIPGLKHDATQDYWLNRYNPLSDKMQAVYREPVLNRMSVFTGDPGIRLMLGQAKSTIDFRRIMDTGQWLIINLSKGQLRENSHILGALLIAKLKLAAMTRAELPERARRPFYGFVDEFQNFASEDFETILSEARKYGLGLALSHQNLDQIDRQLQASILGNVGTQIFFRLSHRDTAQVAQEMDQKARPLIEKHLIDFKVGQAYVKLRGEKSRLLRTIHVPEARQGNHVIQMIKDLSFANFARPKRAVEAEIEGRQVMFSSLAGPVGKSSPGKKRVRTARPGESLEGWHDW